jgi:hypothetical protein
MAALVSSTKFPMIAPLIIARKYTSKSVVLCGESKEQQLEFYSKVCSIWFVKKNPAKQRRQCKLLIWHANTCDEEIVHEYEVRLRHK